MAKKPRRTLVAAAQETVNPPDELTDTQSIARVVKIEGNGIFTCQLPNKKEIAVELEARFRGAVFMRRGGYVLVDLASADERPASSRLVGEIINIVHDEKEWRKQPYWPKAFVRNDSDDSDGEESTVGKMPPNSDDESDGQ